MIRGNLKLKGIISFFTLAFVAFIALNSCTLDHTLDPHKYGKIYISLARKNPVKYSLVKGIDTGKTIEFRAVYGGPGKPKHDISVHLSIDPSLVDSFNIKHFTSYPVLPEGNYELSSNSTIIPTGQTYSDSVTLKIKRKDGTPDNQYLLPVTINETNSPFKLNENLKTTFFVVDLRSLEPVNTPVIITGFLPDPAGADEPEPGHKSWDWVHLPGGYEYIQLMALKDIDFSKHPYSVVICNNKTVQAEGWATGGTHTYKFNLTQGTAKKGTFFYVGSARKVIDGYDKPGESTDISSANWIRAIVVNEGKGGITGDGFGDETTGLLQNINGGGGSSDGIAVFDGTNVTLTSVPIDAIFYNPPINHAYDPPNGYLIPDNEFYSQKDTLGNAQPLFGKGTNTFTVPKPASGSLSNMFCTMGGEVSDFGWLIPREPQWKELGQGSQLSAIQSGNGVTIFYKK